ncbi:MAG: hypothetical protein QXS18_04930 [Thermoplasmata archaeon]
MGKIREQVEIEYAYVSQILIFPNIKQDGKIKHKVRIIYELRDKNKQLVPNGIEAVDHYVDCDGAMKSIVDINSAINNNLITWIVADKKNLSGFEYIT